MSQHNPAGERAPPFTTRTFGLILKVERFDAGIEFYRDLLGLSVWFEKDRLVCFRYGDGYLMVETGGVAMGDGKRDVASRPILRFNVDDVDAAAEALVSRGIIVDVRSFSWGRVGTFRDPDGNICELKNADDPFFR